jgi:putative hydrolase
LSYGCARAEELGLDGDRIVNTWPAERLLAWAGARISG